MMSTCKFGKYMAEVEEWIERIEKLALRNRVASEEYIDIHIRGIEGRNRNENVSARPDGLRENVETALSSR